MDSQKFQKRLLGWYDKYRRELPWRARAGEVPDPYHVWLSEIMLQQTTVPTVHAYFLKFIDKWPTIHDLAAAETDEVMHNWAGLGYYARARNLVKCARHVSTRLGGHFPADREGLLSLPGVGPYTAAAIQSIAFRRSSVVVDGNVERIATRIFRMETPLPAVKKEISEKAALFYAGAKGERVADLPQALMDLGSMVCTPKSPRCGLCPVSSFCDVFQAGAVAEAYPVRLARKEKPARRGLVYWIETPEGKVLLEKRPEPRMLAGMPGFPGSNWDMRGDDGVAPVLFLSGFPKEGRWTKVGEVLHVFTHFSLKLDVMKIRMKEADLSLSEAQYLVDGGSLDTVGFPTLYKKVFGLVRG